MQPALQAVVLYQPETLLQTFAQHVMLKGHHCLRLYSLAAGLVVISLIQLQLGTDLVQPSQRTAAPLVTSHTRDLAASARNSRVATTCCCRCKAAGAAAHLEPVIAPACSFPAAAAQCQPQPAAG